MIILKYLPLVMAMALFTIYYFSRQEKKSGAGSAARVIIAAVSTIMVAHLFYLFLDRNYGIRYVYENSNNDMSLLYRVSAVWAGQAGTLLLWYWMTAVLLLAMRGSEAGRERIMYSAMSLVLVMLGVSLAKIFPFEALPQAPADGAGLNPLLINPWMAIHPPMIFIGYALATVPFALAAAGVIAGDYTGWIRAARPWALAAWAFLGIGVFLGAYWAYEVLGWGGYWSWDPVENASIFPWLVLGALVHGLIIQGNRRRFALWNIVLAFTALITVVLATFLVRSGALSAFSVHSFEKSVLYMPLLLSIAAFIALSAVLSWMAYKGLRASAKPEEKSAPLASQLLSWTVVIFIALLGFIVVGTLFPLISGLFNKPMSVQPYYYNLTTTVVAVPLAALLLLCPLVFVKKIRGAGSWLRYGVGAVGAAAGVALAAAAGVRHPVFILLPAVAGAAGAVNLVNLRHFAGLKRWNLAAYAAHAGVALVIIGVITSTVGTKTQQLRMLQDDEAKAGNVSVRYIETKPYKNNVKAVLDVKIGRTARTLEVEFSPDPERSIAKPVIIRALSGDIYFAPRSIEIVQVSTGRQQPQDGDLIAANRKDRVRAGAYELLLEDWKVAQGHEQTSSVIVVINLFDKGNKKIIEIPFTPGMPDRDKLERVKLDDGTIVQIARIDVDTHTAYLQVTLPGEKPKQSPHAAMAEQYMEVPGIIFDVSRKPFIPVLWLGLILNSAGTLIAVFNRKSRPAADKGPDA